LLVTNGSHLCMTLVRVIAVRESLRPDIYADTMTRKTDIGCSTGHDGMQD
jgi:hypothetical protein